jgi:hypothetical protein
MLCQLGIYIAAGNNFDGYILIEKKQLNIKNKDKKKTLQKSVRYCSDKPEEPEAYEAVEPGLVVTSSPYKEAQQREEAQHQVLWTGLDIHVAQAHTFQEERHVEERHHEEGESRIEQKSSCLAASKDGGGSKLPCSCIQISLILF